MASASPWGELGQGLHLNSGALLVMVVLISIVTGVFLLDFAEDAGVAHSLSLFTVYQVAVAIPAWSTAEVSTYGGISLLFLMALESSSLPIPSEVILPFAGFLVHDGKFSFANALLLSTVGSMVGSYVDYYIGRYLGTSFLLRGKLALDKSLRAAERWFNRYGDMAVFGTRFLAGARTLISFPAGASRMPLLRFSLLTLAGCLIWNAALIYAGYLLSERWVEITLVMRQLYIPIAISALAGLGYLLAVRYRARASRLNGNLGK